MNKLVKLAVAGTLAAVLVVGAVGCGSAAGGDGRVAATVNGVEISESRVQAELDRVVKAYPDAYAGDEGPELKKQDRLDIIAYLVDQELVALAAADAGIEVTDDELKTEFEAIKAGYPDDAAWNTDLESYGYTEQQLKDELEKQMLQSKLSEVVIADAKVEEPSEEEIQKFYDENQYYFEEPAGKRASHILFAPDDKATAERVLGELKEGADFAEMAKKYSIDDSNAENGGELGWATGEEYVDSFKAAFQELEVGQMSDLVETDFGWHIILIHEEREASTLPLDEVRDMIVDTLKSSKSTDAFESFLDGLRKAADIVVFDEEGKEIDSSILFDGEDAA